MAVAMRCGDGDRAEVGGMGAENRKDFRGGDTMNKGQNKAGGRCNGQGGKGNFAGQGRCQGGPGRCGAGVGQGKKGRGQGGQSR